MLKLKFDPLRQIFNLEMLKLKFDPLRQIYNLEMLKLKFDPLRQIHNLEMLKLKFDPLRQIYNLEMLKLKFDPLSIKSGLPHPERNIPIYIQYLCFDIRIGGEEQNLLSIEGGIRRQIWNRTRPNISPTLSEIHFNLSSIILKP